MVPEDSASLDMLKPELYCLRKGGVCMGSRYQVIKSDYKA